MAELIAAAVRTLAVWAATTGQPGTTVAVYPGVFPANPEPVSHRGQYLSKLYDETPRVAKFALDPELEWQRIRSQFRTPYRSGVSDQ